jgi:hypothetical protein
MTRIMHTYNMIAIIKSQLEISKHVELRPRLPKLSKLQTQKNKMDTVAQQQ